MTTKKALLDSSAVLAWLFQEKGADIVEKVIPVGIITSVNYAEVALHASERGHRQPAADLRTDLEALGLEITTEFTAADAVRAGELIAASRREKHLHEGRTLALADAAALAVAERLQLDVVTGDRLWLDLAHLTTTTPMLFR
ncbi:PIN domain-containing protein [Yinghuangia aomiensis]